MRWMKKIGYVSVELVITAALILAVGFFALLNLGTTGSLLMQNGMDKLDALGIFSESEGAPVGEGLAYDVNGYMKDLNVNLSDVNPASDFVFELNATEDGYVLVSYVNKVDKDVVVPRTYLALPVMSIGYGAFEPSSERATVTSIALPNTIEEIEANAFWGASLSAIVIPDSVTSIGRRAFSDNYIATAVFGNSLTTIGEYAFSYNELTAVNFPNSLVSIGGYSFEGNDLTTLSLPEGVTSIGEWAFQSNKLNSVYLPSSLATMGNHAFIDNQISSLTLPAGISVIPDYAFGNNLLTSVVIPNSVTQIGSYAFGNNLLTSIEVPSGVVVIGNAAFSYNRLASTTFKGARPSTLGNSIFNMNEDLSTETIRVPVAYLTDYQAVASSAFSKQASDFVGY